MNETVPNAAPVVVSSLSFPLTFLVFAGAFPSGGSS